MQRFLMLFLKSTSRHFNQTERQTFGKQPFKFLANVNSRSRSIYTIAVPSVVCLSVCNVRAPYSAGRNFRQCFFAIWYLGHSLTSTENFTEIVLGEPLRWGFKRSSLFGILKYVCDIIVKKFTFAISYPDEFL